MSSLVDAFVPSLTVIGPVAAAGGTTTVRELGAVVAGAVAAPPPNVTVETLASPEPVSVIVAPRAASTGVNPRIEGATVYAGPVTPVALASVCSVIAPVAALSGTVAEICVGESIPKTAGMPPKSTPVTAPRFRPEIVTTELARPVGGETESTTGTTVKSPALVPVPASV